MPPEDPKSGEKYTPIHPGMPPTEPFTPRHPIRPLGGDVKEVDPALPSEDPFGELALADRVKLSRRGPMVPTLRELRETERDALADPRLRRQLLPDDFDPLLPPSSPPEPHSPVLPDPFAFFGLPRPGLLRDNSTLETRFLSADAPGSVKPGTRFVIGAQLLVQALGDAVRLRPFEIPRTGRAVALDLHVGGSARLVSESTSSLHLLPGQDSDPARFELQATSAGKISVRLRAFALPAEFLGQITLTIDVDERADGAQRTVQSAAIDSGGFAARAATLEIDVDASQRLLTFTLRGPGTIGMHRAATLELAESRAEAALGLQRKLDTVAKGTPFSSMAVERLLAGTGADLWKNMLPDSIKALLVDNLPAIDSLMIVGDNDPLPWEMLFPSRAVGFLSDRLLVTRWEFGGSRQLRLGAGFPRYVLPGSDKAPPAARAEIDLVEQLVGTGKRISALDELLRELDRAEFGLLHFAAHNVAEHDLPATTWLKLDLPFQQAMLGADCDGLFQRAAPLVFMNACNSSATDLMWVGATGWAGRFLAAGAGAFVGSLWQVRDGQAKAFAACFYAHLTHGGTLGEAFAKARQAVGKEGDPTRLGYTLFGHPAATISLTREQMP